MLPRSSCLVASFALHAALAVLAVKPWPASDAPREAVLAGQGFSVPGELEAPEVAELASEPGAPAEPEIAPVPPAAGAAGATTVPEPGPGEPAAPTRAARAARVRRRPASRAAPGDVAAAPDPALFGAVGDRSAVDLTTAFTRTFPTAASADPQWVAAPYGAAGVADVTFVLDETGAMRSSSVTGNPSPALASGVRRTLTLLRGRLFTARGATTRLTVRAHVTPDQKHDGLHGDVFALGASATGREGAAFFALAIGRRIDVVVRER